MTFQCQEKDISFFENAKVKEVNVVEIQATPEAIFNVFKDANAWTEWFDGITAVEWTSPQPFGVGTTRTVTSGLMKSWEYFFIWEKNKRLSFYFTQTNLPIVKALVEDYQLEEIDGKSTRFTYTVAYNPGLLLILSGPFGKRALGKTFKRAADSLARYMEQD